MLTGLNAPNWLVASYQGTDKFQHGYLTHYRRVLGPRRFRSMTIFEIGVGGYESAEPGGSLQVWRDYFPRSKVIGIDIAEKTLAYGPRVTFARADQSSSADLDAVVADHGCPDIVIDDGSHIGDHQIASFISLWPRLPSGGVYVIEDLSTSYEPSFGGAEPAPKESAIGLLERLLTDVQANDVYWHWPIATAQAPGARYPSVGSVLTFPGIAFIEKM